MTSKDWTQITKSFQKLRAVAVTPYDPYVYPLRTQFDVLFQATDMALPHMARDLGYLDPLVLHRTTDANRFETALTKAQNIDQYRIPDEPDPDTQDDDDDWDDDDDMDDDEIEAPGQAGELEGI